jgi:MerR family transcriptional regulator, redox-sensitive transcriptional activator SoxR
MPEMQISEIARRAGLRASAVRYYERIGLLLPARRVSGQRRYDLSVLARLAVIERARQSGFTLAEIRRLFSGFHVGTPPSERWRALARKKLVELDELTERIKLMKSLIRRWQKNCHCDALEECGQRLLLKKR